MRMRLFPLMILTALLASGPAIAAERAPEEIRLRIVEQINRDRVAAGAAPVQYAPELSAAADPHCEEMLRENYASHWNRAGWTPYLRYAHRGIRDNTAENIASFWCVNCNFNLQKLLTEALAAHGRFMAELPPNDGHRKSILDPAHTHVGVGLAFSESGFRMIELFSGRYAELDALPLAARLHQNFRISGRVTAKDYQLMGVSVFYEPIPQPMTLRQLKESYSYSLPSEERVERPSLLGTPARYTDGTWGTVEMRAGGGFQVPLHFWKQQPGVYTVAIWVRRGREAAFVGANTSIVVEK